MCGVQNIAPAAKESFVYLATFSFIMEKIPWLAFSLVVLIMANIVFKTQVF
jgi:hypothetical protein